MAKYKRKLSDIDTKVKSQGNNLKQIMALTTHSYLSSNYHCPKFMTKFDLMINQCQTIDSTRSSTSSSTSIFSYKISVSSKSESYTLIDVINNKQEEQESIFINTSQALSTSESITHLSAEAACKNQPKLLDATITWEENLFTANSSVPITNQPYYKDGNLINQIKTPEFAYKKHKDNHIYKCEQVHKYKSVVLIFLDKTTKGQGQALQGEDKNNKDKDNKTMERISTNSSSTSTSSSEKSSRSSTFNEFYSPMFTNQKLQEQYKEMRTSETSSSNGRDSICEHKIRMRGIDEQNKKVIADMMKGMKDI